MRFQQLKHDPNNVTKKRLVKSKKNWVVLTSLSIAGGLLLFSTPELTVDAASNEVKTTTKAASGPTTNSQSNTAAASVSSSQKPVTTTNVQTTPVTPNKKASAPTVTTVNSINAPAPIAADKTTDSTPSDVKPAPSATTTPDAANTTKQPDVSASTKPLADKTAPTQVPVTTNKSAQQPTVTKPQTDTANKVDSHLKPDVKSSLLPTLTPGGIINGIVNSITGNKAPETTDSDAVTDKDTPDDPMNDKTNLESGISNTSHWYISSDKTLHFIDGTLADNANKKASPWSKDSENITSASFDGQVKASVHMNNMFSNLPRLQHIYNIENVDFSQTEDISGMLSNDGNLQDIDLTKNHFSIVRNAHGLLENDANLKSANMENSTFSNVTDYSNLFKNDSSLKDLNLNKWQMLSAQNLSSMFQNDVSLNTVNIRTWDISPTANTGDSTKNEGMFDGTNFSSITLGSFNRFSPKTELPSNLSNTWQEIGSGSVADPNGSKTFQINQLGVAYPQDANGNNYIKTTFAPKPGSIKGSLVIHTTTGNSTEIKDVTVPNITGNIGDTIIVNAPIKDGYTPSRSTVTAQVVDKNNIVVTDGTLHYTGNPIHDAVVTIPITTGNQTQTVGNISGHVGDIVEVDIPKRIGYSTANKTIEATINADGTVSPIGGIKYDPNPSSTSSMIVTSNKGDITLSNITGHHVGDQFTVTVPGKKGYNNGKDNVIDAVVDTSGNIVMADPKGEKIQYIGDPVSNITLTLPVIINGKDSGTKTFTYASGHVDDKVQFTVDAHPDYDVNQALISAIVTPDGQLKLVDSKDQISYTGSLENGSVSVENNLDKPININVSGHVGETVTAGIPQKEGYNTNGATTINVTIGPKNNFTTNDKITYIPNDAPTQDVTISSNKGDKIAKNITNHKVNDSFLIQTPTEPGYTPDLTKVHATVDLLGKIHVSDKVNYSPNTVTANITVKSNKGPQTMEVSGKVDKTIKVKVPTITGYKPDKDTISVKIGTDEKLHFTADSITYTGLPAKAQDVTVKSNQGDQTVHIDNTHKVGDSFDIVTPPKQGYTSNTPLHFTIDPNGNAVTKDEIKYQGNTITANVNIASNYPEAISQNATGTVGSTVQVDVPQKDGYTTDKKQVQATVNPDGSITTKEKVKYTGNTVDGKVLVHVTLNGKPTADQNITVKQVQVGSTIHPTPNPIKGYHLKNKDFVMNATVNPHDITSDDTLDYVGDDVDQNITVNSNLGQQTLHVVGKVGDIVEVQIPHQTNYHLENSKVKVDITPDGISAENPIEYLGDPVENLTLTVPTDKNGQAVADTIIPVSNAHVGDKIPFTPKPIQGYTPDEKQIWGIVNSDKTITTTDKIHYHGNPVDNGKLIVQITLNGTDKKTETINVGKTNVGATLDPQPSTIPGYHLDPKNPILTATVDDHGNIKTENQLNYIGNAVTSTIDVPSNLGIQHVKVTGKVGDKLKVHVTNPKGYNSDKATISVTIGADEKPKTSDSLNFTGKQYDHVNLKIPSNKGEQLVTDISGQVGKPLQVNVPKIPGYTSNQQTVAATIDPDGNISTAENIVYTQIPQSSSIPDIETISKDIHVNTFTDQPKVPVYKQVDQDQMDLIPNDLVDPGTVFLSNKEIQINGIKYYQIGINKYIKVDQAYSFVPTQQQIQIIAKSTAPLYTATGSLIDLRHVVGGSIWKVDQIIILNDVKYYRIGTNAFVKETDAVLR